MVLVELFETDSIERLQEHVNKFLGSKDVINVIDIKYNHYNVSDGDAIWYTALVIYSGNMEYNSVPTAEGETINKVPEPLKRDM